MTTCGCCFCRTGICDCAECRPGPGIFFEEIHKKMLAEAKKAEKERRRILRQVNVLED